MSSNAVADLDDIDASLARHLNGMSLQERTELFEEIHGVLKPIEETPSFIQERLDLLEIELNKIPDEKKQAYNAALKVDKEYVQDEKFRLMFLRVDRFNVKLAAIRLVTFLDKKQECFGVSLLTRRVFFTDLDADAQSIVKSGALQVFPARDRSGRVVTGHFKPFIPPSPSPSPQIINSAMQALLYLMLAIADDEENQKNGVVCVAYYVGTSKSDFFAGTMMDVGSYIRGAPIRFCAIHFCTDGPTKQVLIARFLAILTNDNQVKRRVHYGGHTEVQYSLMSFGIDVTALPVTYDGVLKLSTHEKWIARRQAMENSLRNGGTFNGIELPGKDDVLLGRGRLYYQHHGNVRMRELVEKNLAPYEQAKVGKKWKVAEKIVNNINQSSGRFLERDKDGWWVEVSDEQARKKISKTFASISRSLSTTKGDQKRPPTAGNDDGSDGYYAATDASSLGGTTAHEGSNQHLQPHPPGKRSRLTDPYKTEENGTRLLMQQQQQQQGQCYSSTSQSTTTPSSSCLPEGFFCSPHEKK